MQDGLLITGDYKVIRLDYFFSRDAKPRIITTRDIRFPVQDQYPLRQLRARQEEIMFLAAQPSQTVKDFLQDQMAFGTLERLKELVEDSKLEVEADE